MTSLHVISSRILQTIKSHLLLNLGIILRKKMFIIIEFIEFKNDIFQSNVIKVNWKILKSS